MKVILLQDVPKVGKRYEVKEVKSGLARNFLIPKNLAELATDKKVAHIEKLRERHSKEIEVRDKLLLNTIKDLSGYSLKISTKCDEVGSLFSGIHKEDIIASLKKERNIEILPENITLEEPIKKIGEYKIKISTGNSSEDITLVVEKE